MTGYVYPASFDRFPDVAGYDVVAGADLRLSDDRRVTTPRFTSCPAATTFITRLRGLACIF